MKDTVMVCLFIIIISIIAILLTSEEPETHILNSADVVHGSGYYTYNTFIEKNNGQNIHILSKTP